MNKAAVFLPALIMACLAAGSARAEDETHLSGFYVSPRLGATMLRATENTFSTTMVTGGLTNTVGELDAGTATASAFSPSFAVGYEFATRWQQPVRLELAWLDGGSVSQSTTMQTTMNSSWTNLGAYVQSLPTTVQREQKTRVSTLMMNGYYDYTTGTAFTPYISGGVGVAFLNNTTALSQSGAGLSFSSDDFSNKNTRLAWSLGFGVAWAVTPALSADLGYQFTNAGDVRTEGTASNGITSATWESHTHLQLHTVLAGIRYTF